MTSGRRVRPWLGLALMTVSVACGQKSPAAPTPAPTPGPAPVGCAGTPGTTCFGTLQYVEFAVGDFPVVISVPHGGALAPADIPDRTSGTTVTDTNTIDLGRAVAQAFATRTGRRPHLVIAHLRRTKLDANRDVGEGAQGNAAATQAWNEYHAFIEQAQALAAPGGVRGFYIDLHGHGHAIQRLELGYLLSSAQLDLNDAQMNASGAASASSLRLALPLTDVTFAELLRGPSSLGGYLGVSTPSVPSPAAPSPGSEPYFEGGYSTERHTARLPGVQIESNFTGVRDSAANRGAFADRLVTALLGYLERHLGIR